IPLKAYLPEGDGPFPVIVFAHGEGGSKDGYDYLGRYWAKHGYVVLHPTHIGVDPSGLQPGVSRADLPALAAAAEDPVNFAAEIQDVRYIINQLPTLADSLPGMSGKVDTAHVGMAGHSLGASTALAMAGARVTEASGQVHDYSDPRPLAFLAMSPQGPEQGLFVDGAWSQVLRPVFVVIGTQDKGVDGSPWTVRRKVYEDLPPGDKVLAVFRGAAHQDFSDSLGRTALDKRVQHLTLAWWNYTLKGQAEFKPQLLQALPQSYQGAVKMHSK
ncbi:MAG TPA: hypothetical protein VNZ67_04165, partial [bacterium]|nr:hypothetical protein [bacterium]